MQPSVAKVSPTFPWTNLTIFSNNQNGSRNNFHNSLKHDLHQHHIAFLQETHIQHQLHLESLQVIASAYNHSKLHHSPLPNIPTRQRGGVATLISPTLPNAESFIPQVQHNQVHHYLLLCGTIGDQVIYLHNIYAPVHSATASDPNKFSTQLVSACSGLDP